jgi:hypothetical protein
MTATRVGEPMPVTAEGYEQLWLELETLRVEGRRQIGERLREARSDGHLADNPALYDVLVEQAQLERRISTLEEQVAAAQVVAPARKGVAAIGTSVRVRTSLSARSTSTSWSARSSRSATGASRSALLSVPHSWVGAWARASWPRLREGRARSRSSASDRSCRRRPWRERPHEERIHARRGVAHRGSSARV